MMNILLKKLLPAMTAAVLAVTSVSALADSVEVDGTVVSIDEAPVIISYTGTVDQIRVTEGAAVQKGDTIATLKTTKVYAQEDGTVRLFGDVGDSAAMVTGHYGAVAYIEPAVAYTISASTRNAYDAEKNRIVHPGEAVYLRSNTNSNHIGTGVVTQVSGTSFTVDILTGNFESGESINVFRDAAYTATERIGRGNAARAAYTVYEGSGIIAAFCVENGASVKKGDVLFETIEGDFVGGQPDLTEIKASESGVVAVLSLTAGAAVTAQTTVCTIYPDASMRVKASVNEEYLSSFPVGQRVKVSFTYMNDGDCTVMGTVESVSAVGTADAASESDEAWFDAIIKLDNNNGVSYGMHVTVMN